MSSDVTPESASEGESSPGFPVKHFWVIASVIFAISVLKGLRLPNLWVATHMTFNYSQGFVRRGLIGELLWLLGGGRLYNYNFVVAWSYAFLVAVAVALALLLRKILRKDGVRVGFRLAILVFASSPATLFFVHMNGYYDHIGLLLVLLFIFFSPEDVARPRYRMFYLAGAICVFLAFIHETLIIMFLPTLLFVLASQTAAVLGRQEMKLKGKLVLAAHFVLTAAAGLIASVAINAVGTRSPETIKALQLSMEKVAKFPLRGDAFEALARPIRENLFSLMPGHWRQSEPQGYLIRSFIVVLPGLVFLIYYGLALIGRTSVPKMARLVMRISFLAACLAPLSLHFVGWDAARWDTICVICAFCCIASMKISFSVEAGGLALEKTRPSSRLGVTLALVVIALGIGSNNFLFDDVTVQFFPFDRQFDFLIQWIKNGFTYLPPR
jgi:hypothetical protein